MCSRLAAFPEPLLFLITGLTPSQLIILKYLRGEKFQIKLYQVPGDDSTWFRRYVNPPQTHILFSQEACMSLCVTL